MTTTKRLSAENSVLIAIDVQEKLLVKIPAAERLIRSIGFLLDVARALEVPILATEQYPNGLGPTTAELAHRLPRPVPKTAFSCCGSGTFLEELEMLQRPNVVLCGLETHVCVMQTAWDLIEAGLHVLLPVDGLASRFAIHHETALRRIE